MSRRPQPTAGPIVQPVDAATVVLVRPAAEGIEVFVTERPPTMAFAAGATVFPGGRVDSADADPRLAEHSTRSAAQAVAALGGAMAASVALAAHHAAIRELFEEVGVLLASPVGGRSTSVEVEAARRGLLDGSFRLVEVAERLEVRLDSAALVPIARWVTPAAYARRFDAWFFAAELPDRAVISVAGSEVASHRWLGPAEALEAMAHGRLSLWIPTSATLQRLARVSSFAELRGSLATGSAEPPHVERPAADRIEIVAATAGGAPGSVVTMTVVGRRDLTVVDPGDPSPEALSAILAAATELNGTIAAILLTSPEPEHAAGADELAERTGAPVYGPPGSRRVLPFEVVELPYGERLPIGDAGLRMTGAAAARD